MSRPRPPSHRERFAAGVLLAVGLGAFLTHRFTQQAVRTELADVERRVAVVSLGGLGALVARLPPSDDRAPLRAAVAAWDERTPSVAQARVLFLSGARLEASTAPEDTGSHAAPRRLEREEKPFYDRAQRLRSAVRENREEGAARKPEIEIAPAATGRRLSLAEPVEDEDAVVGMVEIETTELPPQPTLPLWPAVAAVAAALALFGLGALVLGRRRGTLAALAILCVAGALGFLFVSGTARVRDARHGAAQAVADAVARQAELLTALAPPETARPDAPPPSSWDADAYRRPLGRLTPAGRIDPDKLAAAGRATDASLRKSLIAAWVVALAVFLVVGLGGVSWLASTGWRNRQAYLYIAPAMIGMLVLVFFPFFYGITLSFTDSNLYNSSQPLSEIWVGLDNYAAILGDFEIVKHGAGGAIFNYLSFYWTLGFTIFWTVTNVTIGVTSGLILALVLDTKGLAFRPVYRVLLILPWALPNYITALIWKGMFHRQFGVVNQILQMFGLSAVSWFDTPFTSYLTALTTNAWLSFPFMMVVSLGALQSIPADLYEAARVDGANRWQAFRAITLPSLRPALVPAVILSVVWTFNMFNIIYLVTGGEPGGATEILVTQAYKFAFERYRYGYAAAYSTVIFGILLCYGILQNRISKGTEA